MNNSTSSKLDKWLRHRWIVSTLLPYIFGTELIEDNSNKYTNPKMPHADKVRVLKTKLQYFTKKTQKISGHLKATAKGFHEQYLEIQKYNIAGVSSSVLVAKMSAVGFGLSFFTFGTSLALTVAGAVIGGAGGVTSGVKAVDQYGKESKASQAAEELLEKYEKTRNGLIQTFYGLIEVLGKYEMDQKYPLLTNFITKFLYGSVKTAWSTAY
ncbi:hypothetical protein DPMN_023464 [Dreissena polymorpha]|uniref:Uncharacterized protein n=1 Tax=Dreissena polymorpha TaxID=45954 RepID=A0A9D4LPQ6_DREPO|nr:hypothetical protein DPMN_023464 [Dreissena polymorpha]